MKALLNEEGKKVWAYVFPNREIPIKQKFAEVFGQAFSEVAKKETVPIGDCGMAKVSKKRKRFSVCHRRGLHTVFERSDSVESWLNRFEGSRVSKPLFPSSMGRRFTHRRGRE